MSLYELCDWKETKAVLMQLKEMCTCLLCKKVSENPQEYICGHFFCKKCVDGSVNACPICSVPSHAQDIRPDLLVSSSINVLNVLSQLLLTESDSQKSVGANELDANSKALEAEGSKRKSAKAKGGHGGESKPTAAKRQTKASERLSLPAKIIHEEKPAPDQGSSDSKNKIDFKKPAGRARKSRKSEPTLTVEVQNEKKKTGKSLSAIDKKNAKGETKLQIACIKGDVQEVNQLLQAGANPNTKDFAGWTPLHEAVQRNNMIITEILLRAGSMVNATGAENLTALHEAVFSDNLDIAKLLVSFGANINARSSGGYTPSDLASSDSMKNVLQNTLPTEVQEQVENSKTDTGLSLSKAFFFFCNLSAKERQVLQKLCYKFPLQVSAKYKPEVTHVVTGADSSQNCTTSLPVYCAILSGKWIISFQWVLDCIAQDTLLDHSSYEVKGTVNYPGSEAASKGRSNAMKQLPGIFDGCHVYVALRGNVNRAGLLLNKADLISLIQLGGGSVLYREPNPESVPDNECTVPFHADSKGPLAKCSHYIIYASGKGEPLLKYKMQHIKTLPVDWLLECIEKFELCSP